MGAVLVGFCGNVGVLSAVFVQRCGWMILGSAGDVSVVRFGSVELLEL